MRFQLSDGAAWKARLKHARQVVETLVIVISYDYLHGLTQALRRRLKDISSLTNCRLSHRPLSWARKKPRNRCQATIILPNSPIFAANRVRGRDIWDVVPPVRRRRVVDRQEFSIRVLRDEDLPCGPG